jgi:hypothetical protein
VNIKVIPTPSDVRNASMKIELTYEGKKYIIDNVSVGGQIQVEYTKSDGTKMFYCLKITNSEKAVLN